MSKSNNFSDSKHRLVPLNFQRWRIGVLITVVSVAMFAAVTCRDSKDDIPIPNATGAFPLRELWTLDMGEIILGLDSGEGVVVAATQDEMVAVNLTTGSPLWRSKINNANFAYSPVTILIDHGFVYLANYTSIYCLKLGTGEVIWEYKKDGTKELLAVSAEHIFVEITSWKTLAIDKKTGFLHWAVSQGRSGVQIHAAENNDIVYIGFGREVYAYKDVGGALLQKATIGEYEYKNLAFSDKNFFYCELLDDHTNGPLKAFSTDEMTEVWSKITYSNVQVLSTDGTAVYVLTHNRMVKLDVKSGQDIWNTNMDSNYYRTPVFVNGNVYIRGQNPDVVVGLDNDNGSYLGELSIDPKMRGAIGLYDDFYEGVESINGDMLIFAENGVLFAYGQ